jgi:hypothetical protein
MKKLVLKDIAEESHITRATEVKCLGVNELEWEHCYPGVFPTRFICGEGILFTAKVEDYDQKRPVDGVSTVLGNSIHVPAPSSSPVKQKKKKKKKKNEWQGGTKRT